MSHFSKPCLDILQIIKISPAQNLQFSFSFDLIEFKTLTLQAPTVGQSFNEKNIKVINPLSANSTKTHSKNSSAFADKLFEFV